MLGLSPVAASGGHSSSRCAGLSLPRPLSLRSTGSRRAGSAIVAHGPSCSAARGILPDQGSNPCPLHSQADSQPLRHQGSPVWQNLIPKYTCYSSPRPLNSSYHLLCGSLTKPGTSPLRLDQNIKSKPRPEPAGKLRFRAAEWSRGSQHCRALGLRAAGTALSFAKEIHHLMSLSSPRYVVFYFLIFFEFYFIYFLYSRFSLVMFYTQ